MWRAVPPARPHHGDVARRASSPPSEAKPSVSPAPACTRKRSRGVRAIGRGVIRRTSNPAFGSAAQQLWMGRAAEADRLRAVLLEHPHDVDAAIGLGTALTRGNRTTEAIAVLEATRADAGENADFFRRPCSRAYRHEGRPREARDLFVQALPAGAGRPRHPRRAGGGPAHLRSLRGLRGVRGNDARGRRELARRNADPEPACERSAPPSTEWPGCGAAMAGRTPSSAAARGARGKGTVLSATALGGPATRACPSSRYRRTLTQHSGSWELGGGVRLAPFRHDGRDGTFRDRRLGYRHGRWRLDARYTYSPIVIRAVGEDGRRQLILLRGLRRQWRRVWITGSYAHESRELDVLTADRVGSSRRGHRVGRRPDSHTVAPDPAFDVGAPVAFRRPDDRSVHVPLVRHF